MTIFFCEPDFYKKILHSLFFTDIFYMVKVYTDRFYMAKFYGRILLYTIKNVSNEFFVIIDCTLHTYILQIQALHSGASAYIRLYIQIVYRYESPTVHEEL